MKYAIIVAQQFKIGLSYIAEILQCDITPTTIVCVDTIGKHIFPFE